MAGLYVGATAGYSGKNMVIMGIGLRLQKEGYSVGYLKPVGAMPREIDGRLWDDDAYHVQRILRTDEDPQTLTPVIASHDFQVRAFRNQTGDVMGLIRGAYEKVSAGKDVTLVGGSGGMHTGRYCNADGVRVVRELGLKALVIDRSDVHLVALEGDSPCLVLTGNLYPNDIILTRSEVLEIPIIVVREDTYTVAKKMETLLMRHKLRDEIKIRQGAQLINANLDFAVLLEQLGLGR